MTTASLILLAAGGTGGHLFPAEALGVELIRRGLRVRLATDGRALRYTGLFSKDTIDVVPSETVRGRSPWRLAYTGAMLAAGTAVSLNLMRRLKPAARVGFRGHPHLPPRAAPTAFSQAASARSRPRCRACSIAIRRSRARQLPSARRCVRPSSPRPRSPTSRPSQTGHFGCWWSAAARARG